MLLVHVFGRLLAVLWLLLLSLLLGWPGFIGMLMFLVGLGLLVSSLTSAVLDGRVPEPTRAGPMGTILIFSGVYGMGLVARLT